MSRPSGVLVAHERCGERLACPCWIVGAQEEAGVRQTRIATRELTDYIRVLGDSDPAMTSAEVAAAAYRVFASPDPDPLAVPWPDDDIEARIDSIVGRYGRALNALADCDDDHAVLLARARRAKRAQWTAFLVGLALGAAAGVVVAWVWLR